jgi:hypothetical protein
MAIVRIGRVQFRLGQYEAARINAQQAISLAGSGPDSISHVVAEALLILGNCAAETNSLVDAETYYRRAVDICREQGYQHLRKRALDSLGTGVHMPRGWCPQCSLWEGTLGENHYRWPFRDAHGDLSTHDWEIPGAYGFHNTTLKVYECDVPDEGYAVTSIVVEADGQIYQDDDGAPDADGAWSFGIAYAHTVNIIVTAEETPGATKAYTSHGSVLIDPDGFVFDSTRGFEVISSTLDGVPLEVANTIPGVTVTSMVSMPAWGGWVPWPAQYYDNQTNPQVTGEDGYFAFFTPPGLYYLQVDGLDGYQGWRSPVIEVITEIVHVNVPLTPLPLAGDPFIVTLTPHGPNYPLITVEAGSYVRWISTLDAQASASDLARYTLNPMLRVLSSLDPMINLLGWDSGMLAPGSIYQRQFTRPGVYTYSDGAGQTGVVSVIGKLFLPVIRR